MKVGFALVLVLPVLVGCQMVDWHCTRGGQWSPWYTLNDGRCTYFCADKEEKFCGKSTEEAEAKMANDPTVRQQREKAAAEGLSQDKEFCQKLGFKPDTDAMANCLLTQQQNRFGLLVKQQEQEVEGAKAEAEAWSNVSRSLSNTNQRIINDMPKTTNCSTYGSQTSCTTW